MAGGGILLRHREGRNRKVAGRDNDHVPAPLTVQRSTSCLPRLAPPQAPGRPAAAGAGPAVPRSEDDLPFQD
jgi:hypothetical protein